MHCHQSDQARQLGAACQQALSQCAAHHQWPCALLTSLSRPGLPVSAAYPRCPVAADEAQNGGVALPSMDSEFKLYSCWELARKRKKRVRVPAPAATGIA